MFRRFGAALLLAVVAVPLEVWAEVSGPTDGVDRRVVVVEANVTPELEPLQAGFVEWLRLQLGSAGLPVHSGLAVRRALAADRQRHRGEARLHTRKLIELASTLGGRRALLVDVRLRDGRTEAVLRVYDMRTAKLVAARRTAGPPEFLGRATAETLVGLLSELGHAEATLPIPGEIPLADFSAMSRALVFYDEGRAARSWEELVDAASAAPTRLQNQIASALDHPKAPTYEKARLVAARGNQEAAWQMIGPTLESELLSPTPRADVLAAAGEIELARGRTSEAKTYFERAQRADPKLPLALVGLAKALQAGGDVEGARTAYQKAMEADPTETQPAVALAGLAETASERAGYLMEAADRAALQLDVDRALVHYERAAEVDPGIEGRAREHTGDLYARLGQHAQAIAAYEKSIEIDGPTALRLRALAHANRAVGEVEAAYQHYHEALDLDDSDYVTLRELGVLYRDSKRTDEAMPLLEAASMLAPEDPETQREFARTLAVRGEHARALELYNASSIPLELTVGDLRTMAEIQQEVGEPEAARILLEQAVEADPVDTALREELAVVYERDGDPSAAEEQRAVGVLLEIDPLANAGGEAGGSLGASSVDASRPAAERFAALIQTFGPRLDRVVLLGLNERRDWLGEARHWLWPWAPDLSRLEREVEQAIGEIHGLATAMSVDSYVEPALEELQDFDSPESLSALKIADVNFAFASDATFVGLITRRQRGSEDIYICGSQDFYELELRLLEGSDDLDVSVFSNKACLPDGVATYASLNQRALVVWLGVFVLIVYPFLRGWGRVVVRVKLPPKTKAIFAISLKKKPEKLREMKTPARGSARMRIEMGLRKLNRYERPLDQNRPSVFTMIPVRRKPYFLTVRGPLLHSVTEDVVGNFLESKQVEVRRGRTAEVEFDLAPNEAAIHITVIDGTERVPQAMVTIAERRDLLRYCKDGTAFLYVGEGEFTLIVSDRNRVAERRLPVYSYDAQTIEVDLSREEEIYFSGCPPAAMQYIEGDYAAAARSLEAAGKEVIAHEIRARWLTNSGRVEEASAELEAAGQHDEAARLLATHSQGEMSASLFEQAGDYAAAARAYHEAGEMEDAARAYESAYDYDNALECYQSLGDPEKVIELLEKTSDYLEAGRVAYEAGQLDRAIYDLQQCDKRHLNYSEVCRLLADILFARGELDVAIAKVEEAIEAGGIDSCPIELHQRYAAALEEVAGPEAALAAYEQVRQRDLTLHEVSTRIEVLRKEISRIGETPRATARPESPPAAAAPSSRYEILEELGRGGMGVVYKARDTHLGRIVALKQLTETMKDHPAAVQFFEREARSAAVLNHQNIVTVYDAGQENGSYFISMEFMEGTPLDAVLKKRGAIQPPIVARLATQIAEGLDYAHRNKIIHRDIKTANLFFTRDKVVKIMDFGLAKMVEEVRRGATVIGGTPYYMAPEQAAGENVDQRADLYALGVTLFQMLSGAVPFDKGDVAYHHRHTPAPDVREVAADVPEAMARLIAKLLEKDPAARIQTAGEVGQIFQAWLETATGR